MFPEACEIKDLDKVTIQDLGCIFSRILAWVMLVAGATFVILLIISGIRYMAAGGDEKAIAQAKKAFFAAVLGFILIFTAATIITFIGQIIKVPDILRFNIPGA